MYLNRLSSDRLALGIVLCFFAVTACGQDNVTLEESLKASTPKALAAKAEAYGSPRRGALLFYRSAASCAKCHLDGQGQSPLGPKLTQIGRDVTRESIIESILYPSKKIADSFRTVKILSVDGDVVTGVVHASDDQKITIGSAANVGQSLDLDRDDIESLTYSETSMMPEGIAAALGNSKAFFDVVEYVFAVARGGEETALSLRPNQTDLLLADDTENLDHAGILRNLKATDMEAGRRIYHGYCVNCHGADGNTPKLVTARAFGTQPLKFGSDPYAMLRTLTLGNGLMGPMRHLSPKERYQVIFYIRERLMKDRNKTYQPIDRKYLAGLPKGTDDGEAKMDQARDFGPVLASQLGGDVQNGLTFRLSDELTYHFDLHRFRSAGTWTDGFLDLSETQHYRQRGEQMPKRQGIPLTGLEPFAWELTPEFEIPESAKPPRGPVDSTLATYFGHYLYGDRAVLSYRVHDRKILETVEGERMGDGHVVRHTYRIEPGDDDVRLRVIKQTRQGETPLDQVASADSVVVLPAERAGEIAGSSNRNQPLHVVEAKQARKLDLGTPNRTLLVRFRTGKGGTLVASTPQNGRWQPNGKTLFVRGGRLVFDIGWVGAITSRKRVADRRWHQAALVVTDQSTQLYVDGKLQAQRDEFRRPANPKHVLKVGATADNFGGDLDGEIAWAQILSRALSADEIGLIAKHDSLPIENSLWHWEPGKETSRAQQPSDAKIQPLFVAAALSGDVRGLRWDRDGAGGLILEIPPDSKARVFELSRMSLSQEFLGRLDKYVALRRASKPIDPASLVQGGPTRWPEVIESSGQLGQAINGYALDTIDVPMENPWNAWMRTSALDFFDHGRAVVTTHGGDVYLVDGIDDGLHRVTWKRFAAGLFEPFGVRVIDGVIYVTCRDGIKRLHDFDGNDEADFVEAFWIDDDVSSMFHAYNFDLQTDSKGNLYFAKAGQYTHHHRPGTIMRIPPQGGSAEVVAFGLRTPNGMGKLADDRFTVSDNQGPWMPAGKVSLIQRDAFLGNMPINDQQDQWLRERFGGELPDDFDEPMIWMPQELDNSCGGQVWVDDPRFGPLSGRLLHSSFGKGWLYHLSLQQLQGKTQASIIALPHQWQAGVMRLRVNPKDGQVYGTGLSGWQGPAGGKDGCLQRIRYSGDPVKMIDRVEVVPEGIELTFNFDLPPSAAGHDVWDVTMWDYKWSRKYGSDQYSILQPGKLGRDQLQIDSIHIASSGRKATLRLPQLTVCDQVLVKVSFPINKNESFRRDVYMTIHHLP